jgi:hypothetical protein
MEGLMREGRELQSLRLSLRTARSIGSVFSLANVAVCLIVSDSTDTVAAEIVLSRIP